MAQFSQVESSNSYIGWAHQSEIRRCLLCKEPPCTAACPYGTDPGKGIRSLYFQNASGAAKSFQPNRCLNCAAPCEQACALEKLDAHIHIRKIAAELAKLAEERADEGRSKIQPDLSLDICGVKLENPFLLSSSVVASNYEMCAKAFEMGWAGACFKTICTFPQHEASPRFSVLSNTPGTFYGFKNIEQLSDHSVESNLEIFRRLKKDYPSKVIIASIMGQNEEEWESLARSCQEAGADVIELNFSCPNMQDGALGVTIGQDEELIERFTRAARKGCRVPLLAKMTPNITDMVPMAAAAKRGGADGIAAINTIKSITGVDIENFTPQPNVQGKSALGGYSGNAVKPIALRFISDLCGSEELAGMHVSGMGGIENWHGALEFILLGAGSLQITTAVMQYGYRIIDDLLDGLASYMRYHGFASLYPLKGAANHQMVNLDEIERDTILFPKFDTEKCIGCGRCEISCYDGGHQAISFDLETRRPKLDASKCVGCHLCRFVCPASAIGTFEKRIHREPNEKN